DPRFNCHFLPIAGGTAVMMMIDNDSRVTRIMVAIIDHRADDQTADETTDGGNFLVAGNGRLGGEGKGGGTSESKSDEFCFHMFSKVGFIPWDAAHRRFIHLFCV